MMRTPISGMAAGIALTMAAAVMTVAPAQSAPVLPTGASQASGLGLSGAESNARPGKRRTKVTAKASARAVIVLQPATVTGKANGPKRKVLLQLKNAYGWKQVDKDKTNKKGRYALKVPTTWYGKKKMRVLAPQTRRFRGDANKVSVRITEGYVPAGKKRSWTRITNYKTRYNPCQTIKYAVNPTALPADGIAVLNEAVFRIELASGLRYKYSGATNAIPFRTTKGKEQDKKANLTVAWSTPETDASNLAGGVLARGGFTKAKWVPKRRTFKLLKTGLLMDASDVYADRGFVNGGGLGAVHMHELTHAAGLGHTNDPSQIMYPYTDPTRPALFGAGDLTGLDKSGQDAGCLSSGNARAVARGPELTPVNLP